MPRNRYAAVKTYKSMISSVQILWLYWYPFYLQLMDLPFRPMVSWAAKFPDKWPASIWRGRPFPCPSAPYIISVYQRTIAAKPIKKAEIHYIFKNSRIFARSKACRGIYCAPTLRVSRKNTSINTIILQSQNAKQRIC